MRFAKETLFASTAFAEYFISSAEARFVITLFPFKGL